MAKVPDNFWKEDSPARMADGRIFTDYYPNCSMNLSIHLAQMTFFGNLFLRSPRWQHHKYKKLTVQDSPIILFVQDRYPVSFAFCVPLSVLSQ